MTAIDFLVEKGLYPMISITGKLYFRGGKQHSLTPETIDELCQELSLTSPESCARRRKEIQARRQALQETRPIREWIKQERPREMLVRQGAETLSLAKLLAILLRTGKAGVSAEELARQLLNHFGSLRALDAAPISHLQDFGGIGLAKVAQIKAALELGKRLARERTERKPRIKSPPDALAYVAGELGLVLRDAVKESFQVIYLDSKNQPIERREISRGTVNASLVDPKEILKEASLCSAVSVILAHNHPSGDPQPSTEDIRLTLAIKEACTLVGLKVLDHIVIGRNAEDYFSFSAAGLLDKA
ncbi:MAG: DNA repair protein RadC [Coprothermobacterota bacterium]|nr:DNA repair protein RadC [Coprothermobacterota bacterium]